MSATAAEMLEGDGDRGTRRPGRHSAMRDFITPAVILSILGLAFNAGISYERINDGAQRQDAQDSRMDKMDNKIDGLPERMARVEETSQLTLQAVQQLQRDADRGHK